ncbi:MAG: NAD(P)-binding domain-containing protein [Bacteriovoracia bacterium]
MPHDVAKIVIVGAGPAGLKLSRELLRRNIPHRVLEKAEGPASSFKAMPSFLKILTPWAMNHLDSEDRELFPSKRQLSAQEIHGYFAEYARKHHLSVEYNKSVLTIDSKSNELILQTDNESIKARAVVFATGYWNNPAYSLSKDIISQASIPVFHFVDNPTDKFDFTNKKVLIVGSRLSAGQIIEEIELKTKGKVSFIISHRSPIRFSPAWIHKLPVWFSIGIEALVARLWPRLNFPVLMDESVNKLIKHKPIVCRGIIERISSDEVFFKNGSPIKCDVLIFTTGFSFSDMAPLPHPNVYYLGSPRNKDFRSRFLRGIRSDAEELAAQLVEKYP